MDLKGSRVPPQPQDSKDALKWFVDYSAAGAGSQRGLFLTDFQADQQQDLEATLHILAGQGIEPFIIENEVLYAQADQVWQIASNYAPFNQPAVTEFELNLLGSPLAVIRNLEAPERAHHLWYLFHYILYPRLLYDRRTIISTPLGLDEFIAYGARCEDFEYAGRKITWEKLTWLIESSMLDLHQFRICTSQDLPPMLSSEYTLYNCLRDRELPVVAQQVLGDYVIDMSLSEKSNRLAIEFDRLAYIDVPGKQDPRAKKHLVLLSDGWKILRLTNAEIDGNLTECADAVQQSFEQGRKRSAVGRLVSGRGEIKVPELPVDDDVQRLAITHGAGPIAVTGYPGVGKTSCIAYRISYLLSQGVNPERVIVFSYSDETTNILRNQIEVLSDAATAQKLNISPWHDFGYRVLKENAALAGRKPPLKIEANPQRVLDRVLRKVKSEMDPVHLELLEHEVDELSVGGLISLYKANMVSAEIISQTAQTDGEKFLAKIYQGYDDALKKSNKIDNDDTISLSAQLLANSKEVRQNYAHKFDFVLVDEYQECTPAQELMCRLLASPQDNLYLSGNEDEAVNESKGGMPHVLSEISIRLPNARCYVLEKNWRAHPALVEHARSFSQNIQKRFIAKDTSAGIRALTGNAVIGPKELVDEDAEADWVASEIGILLSGGKKPSDIVIIWRTQKYVPYLEKALFKNNIPCSSLDQVSNLIPDEAGDVMAFLRLVMDPDGPKAKASFERICQLRSRELDQKLSKLSTTIAGFGEANNLSFLKAIEIYHEATKDAACKDLNDLVRVIRTMNQESLSPAEAISMFKRSQKLHEVYKAAKIPPNVLYEPLARVEQMEEQARKFKTVDDYVRSWDNMNKAGQDKGERSSINLMGAEFVKGHEFPIVFLVGMADGLFPTAGFTDIDEERRLFLIAISRAKELLYVSYPRAYEDKAVPVSGFLLESKLMQPSAYQAAIKRFETYMPEPKAVPVELPPPPSPPQPVVQAPVQIQAPPQLPEPAPLIPEPDPAPPVVIPDLHSAPKNKPALTPQTTSKSNYKRAEPVIPVVQEPVQEPVPEPVMQAPPEVQPPPPMPIEPHKGISAPSDPFNRGQVSEFIEMPAAIINERSLRRRPVAPPPVEVVKEEVVVEEDMPVVEPQTAPEPEPIQEQIQDPIPEPVAIPEPEPVVEPQPVPEPLPVVAEATQTPEPVVVESAPQPEPQPEPVIEPVVETPPPVPEPEPSPVPLPEPAPEPIPVVETIPEPAPVPVPEPPPEPVVDPMQVQLEEAALRQETKKKAREALRARAEQKKAEALEKEKAASLPPAAPMTDEVAQVAASLSANQLSQSLEALRNLGTENPISKPERKTTDNLPQPEPVTPPQPPPQLQTQPQIQPKLPLQQQPQPAVPTPVPEPIPAPAPVAQPVPEPIPVAARQRFNWEKAPKFKDELDELEELLGPGFPVGTPTVVETPAPPVIPPPMPVAQHVQAQSQPQPQLQPQSEPQVYSAPAPLSVPAPKPVPQPAMDDGDSTKPRCPQCTNFLEVSSVFCGECGYSLPERIPPCPSCGEPVEPGAKFCGECGFSLL